MNSKGKEEIMAHQIGTILKHNKMQEWQELKSKYPIVECEQYSSSDAKVELFKKVANYHTDNNFQIVSESAKQIVNNLFKYCTLQPGEYDISKGLYLHGAVGSGKTTLLKIISTYLRMLYPAPTIKNYRPKRIDEMENYSLFNSYSGGFRSINATDIANAYKMSQNGANELNEYTKRNEICFDELGREPIPVQNFGTSLNVLQYILAIRYDNWSNAHSLFDKLNTRTHITTNIKTIDQCNKVDLSELSTAYQPHIADRIREMCNIIHLDEKSFRRL